MTDVPAAPAPLRDEAKDARRSRFVEAVATLILVASLGVLAWRAAHPIVESFMARRAALETVRAVRNHRQALNSSATVMNAQFASDSLVVFTDYQCEYCQSLERVLGALDGEGYTLRVVYHHLPIEDLHPFAPLAALIAVCASDAGAFPAVHRALFSAEAGWQHRDSLPVWLLHAGVPQSGVVDIDRCVKTSARRDVVESDRAVAAELGIVQTPTIIVDDTVLVGVPSLALLRTRLRKGQ